MAWPKLRSPKSPAQSVTVSNHSGTAPIGARSHGVTPAQPASGPAPVQESSADPQEAATDSGVSGDVPFWEWAAEDPAEPGSAGAIFSPDDGIPGTAAGTDPPRSAGPVVTPVRPAGDEEQPGIGQTRGNLSHLAADPRMRGWWRRIIIAVVVGVAFTIVVSWRLGLTLAVIAAIADTVYQSRRGLPGPRGVKMTRAQRLTRRQLAKLRRAGYRAMNGNLIPESEEQIDHLVVGPAGVFAIDSEAWDKKLVVRTKNARQLWHGPFSMKERLEHARWESERAAEMLSGAVGSPVTVRPAMAVYGPRIPWDVVTIREVDVFSGPRLRKYLRRSARQGGTHLLTAAEVERIYRAAHQAFPHLTAGASAT